MGGKNLVEEIYEKIFKKKFNSSLYLIFWQTKSWIDTQQF